MESPRILIQELAASVKRYIEYQKTYVKLDLTEKLTILLTALILGSVIFINSMMAVVFAGLALSSAISYWTGSPFIGYTSVSLLFVLFCVVLYTKRYTLIVEPLAKTIAGILLNTPNSEDDDTASQENI